MIKLEPHQVCPFGSFCEYRKELGGEELCRGLDPNRDCIFICELWAENYERRRRNGKRKIH